MDLRVSVLKIMTLIMLQLWVFVPASTASSHLVRDLRFYQTYKEPVKTSVSVKKVFSPYPQANALSNHCTVAWVTRPECLKGVKDEVKWTRRAPRLLYWHTFDGDTLQVFWRKTLPLNYDQLTERHWKGSWLIWFWTNMVTWVRWMLRDIWCLNQRTNFRGNISSRKSHWPCGSCQVHFIIKYSCSECAPKGDNF